MFDGADFLAFARNCRTVEPQEAANRSAISRASYAAYHTAHRHALYRGIQGFSTTGDAHQQVIAALRSFHDYLGDDLQSLRWLRNRADYDLTCSTDTVAEDLQSALDTAHHLVERLR